MYHRFQGILESQIVTLQICGVITSQGAVKLNMRMGEARREKDALDSGNSTEGLDLLKAARSDPEFVARFLARAMNANLSSEKKASLISILAKLPESSSLLDLYEATEGFFEPPTSH